MPQGGVLGPTSYSFGPNQGLTLSSALPNPANYSIETVFSLSELSIWRRLIEFKDRTADTGLYNFNTSLEFFFGATGPAGAFAPNIDARLVVTRDGATDLFVGYVNGVQHISFTDTAGLAVFSGPDNIIHFFIDDLVFPNEASAGVVDLIRIYDAPLSAQEVAALNGPSTTAIPEPATSLLAAMAASAALARLTRRREGRASARRSACRS